MTREVLAERLAAVSELARVAGQLALAHYRHATYERKGDESLVTVADREVERFLRDEIERRWPGETILGEEMGRRGMLDAECVWLLDPIDGTTNFVHGLPFWCVAIGLLEHGRPVLGVLASPVLDAYYAGAPGLGAWCNEQALTPWVSPGRFTRTDTIAMSQALLCRGLDFGAPVRVRALGSAQLHFAMVAAGACRAGLWCGDYAWDLAAGMALCLGSGCRVTTFAGDEPDLLPLLDGRPADFGLLACGQASHAACLAALEGLA
jgi:myo-inositol-1(or 4)-monophosphatase